MNSINTKSQQIATSLNSIRQIKAKMQAKRNMSKRLRKQEGQAPQTVIEQLLTNIFIDVLGVGCVGIDDNFFELGGYSLLAVKVLSRIRDVFGVELSLSDFFENSTVGALAFKIKESKDFSKHKPRILPCLKNGNPPLSLQQRRMWFLSQLEEFNTVYNLSAAFTIEGNLNIATLESSIISLIGRHDILRTRFPVVDGEPTQVVLPEVNFKLKVIDYSNIHSEKWRYRVQQCITHSFRKPFCIENDLLFRVMLHRLSDSDFVLHFVFHHLIIDASSWEVLTRELNNSYNLFVKGTNAELMNLPVQYTDYSIWQQRCIKGELLGQQLTYWKEQLSSIPERINLPIDRKRPESPTFRGARKNFTVSAKLYESLKNLSRQNGCTLFMTLLAAFKVLLYRYCNQQRICVGTPISGRNQSELENVLGLFLNTLVIYTKLEDNMTFSRLLGKVRKTVLEAYNHQDLPFELLVEQLNLPRDLSRNPAFQVMFTYQRIYRQSLNFSGLSVKPFLGKTSTFSEFDLTLSIFESEEGLEGSLIYSTDLFNDDTITRMMEHFQVLLNNLVEYPHQKISEVIILPNDEIHKLIYCRNNTQIKIPEGLCIHNLFEKQALEKPDAVAVVFDDKQLTYHELNTRANQLAHYLRKYGIGPDALVGICMERSPELIIGLLGILKAGGAYVPMDPEFPKERLMYMARDSCMSIIITQSHLKQLFSEYRGGIVCIDKIYEELSKQPKCKPASCIYTDNRAYVMYTSGSTGNPKGVEITHKSVVNFLKSMKQLLGISVSDILLAVTTISFDISVLEIYLPLMVGARVNILDTESVKEGKKLKYSIQRFFATIMQATPATWRLLLNEDSQGPTGLKALCGGEALSCELANRLVNKQVPLWNMYGPTETTIWSSACSVEKDVISEGKNTTISIGTPIANTQLYILDMNFQLVPFGVPGELYIGGLGLARGYLNSPDLTAESFLPNPFGAKPGALIYKSGDLVNYSNNGNIRFLERIDNQVKLRGYRIELSEIESALLKYEHISECVVIIYGDDELSRKLVAYIVCKEAVSTLSLRRYLKNILPQYMIPSVFVQLESIPRTPNGKVDRKQLKFGSVKIIGDQEAGYVAPATDVEKAIGEIWQRVLGINNVGLHDNFFDVGGHSLLITKVVALIEKKLNVHLPYRLFFNQTLRQLAAVCEERISV